MSAETLGNIGVYWFTIVSTLLFVGVLFKTSFHTSMIRFAFASLFLGFTLTGWYITARRNFWLTDELAAYSSLAIFGGFSVWLTILLFQLLKHNWHFWSWKGGTDEQG